ncbi:hypothetical protein GGX14DRAFT_389031 [Mycena pura]|uniref:Uncharacterized protein n=1 Tax=Mycena pura TaxID=153505 RepID=A0AAD6VSG3_9AGAR|nr:hypothetical protein GGX14DRAFT_389031 [Mycena pura]
MPSTTFPGHTDSGDSTANSPTSFGSTHSPRRSPQSALHFNSYTPGVVTLQHVTDAGPAIHHVSHTTFYKSPSLSSSSGNTPACPVDNFRATQREVPEVPHPVLRDFTGVYRPITVDNRSTPILCNSNRPALGPLARIGSRSDIRSRRQVALDLGSHVFHKPWLKVAVPATRHIFRMVFSDELRLLDTLLTEIECAPSQDHSQFGYRVQQHVFQAVFSSLKLALHCAVHDLRITATSSPTIPTWGNNQRVDEFHSLNDLELLGICFRAEVEHFLVQLDTVHLQARSIAPSRTESFLACTIPAPNNGARPFIITRDLHTHDTSESHHHSSTMHVPSLRNLSYMETQPRLHRHQDHQAAANQSVCGMTSATIPLQQVKVSSHRSPSVYKPYAMPPLLTEIFAPTRIMQPAYTTTADTRSDPDSSSDSLPHSEDETPLNRDANYSNSDPGFPAEVQSESSLTYYDDSKSELAYHHNSDSDSEYRDDSETDLAYHDDSGSDLAYHDDSGSDLAYHNDSDLESDTGSGLNSDVSSEVSSGHDSDSG